MDRFLAKARRVVENRGPEPERRRRSLSETPSRVQAIPEPAHRRCVRRDCR